VSIRQYCHYKKNQYVKIPFTIGLILLCGLAFSQSGSLPRTWGDWQTWGDQGNGTYVNPVLPGDYAVNNITTISPEMNWDKMNRYGRGIWAGAIRYHDNRFWIYFGDPDMGYFMTTAKKAEGAWEPLHKVLDGKGQCFVPHNRSRSPLLSQHIKEGALHS
jgi:hypothetical protein